MLYENPYLYSRHGSPRLSTRSWSAWEFLEALHAFLFASVNHDGCSLVVADPNDEVGSFLYSIVIAPAFPIYS